MQRLGHIRYQRGCNNLSCLCWLVRSGKNKNCRSINLKIVTWTSKLAFRLHISNRDNEKNVCMFSHCLWSRSSSHESAAEMDEWITCAKSKRERGRWQGERRGMVWEGVGGYMVHGDRKGSSDGNVRWERKRKWTCVIPQPGCLLSRIPLWLSSVVQERSRHKNDTDWGLWPRPGNIYIIENCFHYASDFTQHNVLLTSIPLYYLHSSPWEFIRNWLRDKCAELKPLNECST